MAELSIEFLHGKAVALRDLGRTDEAFDTARGDWRRAGRLARWGLRGTEELLGRILLARAELALERGNTLNSKMRRYGLDA